MRSRLLGACFSGAGALVLVSLFLDLVPGDPVDLLLGEQALSVDREALRHAVGLDRPWYVQLVRFTLALVTGQLRSSIPPFERRILPQLASALPYTFALALLALVLALAVALPLGVAAAARRGGLLDKSTLALAVVGGALPRFWIGPVLILVFAIRLDWLPVSGAGGPAHLVLPALTLGIGVAALLARMTRTAMLEALDGEYVVVARAKGLPPRVVLWKHAFRNALLPILTTVGLELGGLLGGAIVTEKVFAWPGMGSLLLRGIERRDYNLVRATVLCFTFCYLAVNLLTDAAYAVADPRVRRR